MRHNGNPPVRPKEPQSVRIFVFLHIATMFTAVALTIGPTIVLRRIGKSGDVPAIRRSFAAAGPIIKAAPALYGLGAALGIVAIFTNGFDPFQPFLLIAYGLFVVATLVGIRFNAPWFARVAEASANSPDAAPSPELAAELDTPVARFLDWFDPLVILLFIFDMVVKPFG
jgi:hypothetical protein